MTDYFLISGEQIEIEEGGRVPSQIQERISKMKNKKSEAYANRLALFSYYMRGGVALEPQDTRYTGSGETINISRLYAATDTAPRAIAAKSAALFNSAILPLGVDSVSVRSEALEKEIKDSLSDSRKAEIKELLRLTNKAARDILADPRSGFLETIANSVADIQNFGTCFAFWDEGKARHIPFNDVYFLLPSSEEWQWYSWRSTHSDAWLFTKFAYIPPQKEASYDIQHLVCPVQTVAGGVFQYLFVRILEREERVLSYEILSPEAMPIFECRLGTGNTIYTTGAGLNNLGSIITVNYANNSMKLSGALTINPHIVKTQFVTFEPEIQATATGMDAGLQDISAFPGRMTTIAVDDSAKITRPFEVFSQPAGIIEIFSKIYADALVNIETGYGADLFSTFGSQLTATEIQEKRAAAIRAFNGLSVQYYSRFMIPLIEKYLQPVLVEKGLKYKIDIYNFSDTQQEALQIERLSTVLQLKTLLAQMAQAIPPGEMAPFNDRLEALLVRT